MSNIIVGNNFNPFLVGLQVTDVNDSSILTYTNFGIESNTSERVIIDYSSKFGDTKKTNNLNILTNKRIEFNLDYSNLTTYTNFGSVSEYFKAVINKILLNYPASLYLNKITPQGSSVVTVSNYNYDEFLDESTFSISATSIINNFNLIYSNNFKSEIPESDLRNIIFNYDKYVIFRKDKNIEFNIIEFFGSQSESNGFVKIKCKGNPFSEISSGNLSIDYHIKPDLNEYRKYLNNNFTKDELFFIKSRRADHKGFDITLKVPIYSDIKGQFQFETLSYIWPTSDGYNPDIDSISFTNFFEALLGIGEEYDLLKTDLIFRQLTPESLKVYDFTDNKNLEKLLRIYGVSFDKIKTTIDNISKIFAINYQDLNTTSDQLIYLLVSQLGLQPVEFVDEEDFLYRLINEEILTTVEKENIPTNINIKIWKNLLNNLTYLYKNKGTRKVLEFLFEFFGFREGTYVINEFIYKVDSKRLDLTNNELVKDNGYPLMVSTSVNPFQNSLYFENYEDIGFDFTKIVDDKKIQIYNKETSDQFINSKELLIGVDPYKQIEYELYYYNSKAPCEIEFNFYPYQAGNESQIPVYQFNESLIVTYPVINNPENSEVESWYPQTDLTFINTIGYTFSEYVENIYRYFINVQNRKTITDGRGGSYPTLKKLYKAFLDRIDDENCINNYQFTTSDACRYLDKLNLNYTQLIEKFVPATTILYSGNIIRNTFFQQQKYVYKKGLDEGSRFKFDITNYNNNNFYTASIVNKGKTNNIDDDLFNTSGEIIDIGEIIFFNFTTTGTKVDLFFESTSGTTVFVNFLNDTYSEFNSEQLISQTYPSPATRVTSYYFNNLDQIIGVQASGNTIVDTLNISGYTNLIEADFSYNNISNIILGDYIQNESLNLNFSNNFEITGQVLSNIISEINVLNNNVTTLTTRIIDFRNTAVPLDSNTTDIIINLRNNYNLNILVGMDLPETVIQLLFYNGEEEFIF